MTAKGGTLTTERLVLRAPVRSDVGRIAQFAGDFEVARMTARIPYPYGLADAEAWLDMVEAEGGAFAITREDEFIGCCGFAALDAHAAEIGYWIGRPWWGQGLGTEAVRALVAYAFASDPVRRRLVASRFADNPASGRVLEKAGFRPTGETEHFCAARGANVPAITYVCRRPGLAARARRWLGEFAS